MSLHPFEDWKEGEIFFGKLKKVFPFNTGLLVIL